MEKVEFWDNVFSINNLCLGYKKGFFEIFSKGVAPRAKRPVEARRM